jgi:hypothetical protein
VDRPLRVGPGDGRRRQVWPLLKTRHDEMQPMDVVATTGKYNIVSWYPNILDTPIEDRATPQAMSGK